MPSQIVLEWARHIAAKGLKIAYVESTTAGRCVLSLPLLLIQAILHEGISCYAIFIKENILKVPHELIDRYTPETAEVTASLAAHSQKLFTCDILVAVTGLTAPGGSETLEKPVGTMFLHILLPGGYMSHRDVYNGSPEEIILQTIDKPC